MLQYSWNDFMISAQMAAGKIIVLALPTNIRNLSIESQGIQRIQKAFEGQITESALIFTFAENNKQLRDIIKFYDYLCECFNYTQKMRISQVQIQKNQQKIIVSRQWCMDEATSSKKQRITIKVFLQDRQGKDVKLESSRFQFAVKLKEVYLSLNSLILKSNTIILTELDYHKKIEQQFQEKIIQIHKKLEDKMAREFLNMKNQMKSFIDNFVNKSIIDSDTEQYKKDKKRKKKSSRQKKKDVKFEESDEETEMPKRLRSRCSNNTKQEDRAKTEESQIKYQEDQQAKRLKNIEELQQKQKIIPIPIQFDQQNPSYYFFAISNKSVTKIGGYDYPMMMLKKIIPLEGTHGIIIKYVIEKKIKRSCCLEIGIIDQKIKQLLHSSICDNYVKFKFNSTTVFTKVNNRQTKKKIGKLRVLKPGESVQLRVNLSLGIISWIMSYGQVVRAEIPKELLNMKLQAFVGIFATGDRVECLDYPET